MINYHLASESVTAEFSLAEYNYPTNGDGAGRIATTMMNGLTSWSERKPLDEAVLTDMKFHVCSRAREKDRDRDRAKARDKARARARTRRHITLLHHFLPFSFFKSYVSLISPMLGHLHYLSIYAFPSRCDSLSSAQD